jgi:hypothetical protein
MTEKPLFELDPHTHARRDDLDTSRAAAHRLSSQSTMLRRLLAAYAVEPLTAEEAAERAGYEPLAGAWKRVADLERLGLVENTDERRPGHSGRLQVVRAITEAGMDAVYGKGPS